jgi:hypothetical protein
VEPRGSGPGVALVDEGVLPGALLEETLAQRGEFGVHRRRGGVRDLESRAGVIKVTREPCICHAP